MTRSSKSSTPFQSVAGLAQWTLADPKHIMNPAPPRAFSSQSRTVRSVGIPSIARLSAWALQQIRFLRRRDPRSIGENNIGNALSIMTISPPIHCGAPDKVALCTCLARVAQALPVISLGVPFSSQQLAEGDQRR